MVLMNPQASASDAPYSNPKAPESQTPIKKNPFETTYDWRGQPTFNSPVEFVQSAEGGRGAFRTKTGVNSDGSPIYSNFDSRDPRRNQPEYNYQGTSTERTRLANIDEKKRLQAREEAKDKADREKYEAAQAAERERLRLAGISSDQQGAQIQGTLKSIENTGKIAVGQLTLSNTIETNRNTQANNQLEYQKTVHKDDVTDRQLQHELDRDALTASNKLGQDKLTADNQHFQQQLESDNRASRRTQVLGALTLISQAAARF